MQWWMFIPIAFVSGSIPFGYLIGKINGVDIRTKGSGNIGATNLGRVLGRRFFYACFSLDFAKGMFPTLIAGNMMGTLGTLRVESPDAFWWLGVMVAAVLGHMFTPWLKFKGGKGVATAMGALVGILPAMTLPATGALVVYLVVVLLWRYVSLASCTAAASLPLWVWMVFAQYKTLMERQASTSTNWESLSTDQVQMIKSDIPNYGTPFFIVTLLLAIMVIYKHKTNLGRIMRGQEPQIRSRDSESSIPEISDSQS
ncbi:MAG: glycerol-3-phosphate 1-O-acyltransferase PlsY [Phycisphaerales bacterium]|nr:glycerol-3-phosphate 1-O-acyltransferase PlsY [Phycisphaerales bacterium]